jgi:8-oxo-dGTP pyrophosphatase MutT (NUDIX family)
MVHRRRCVICANCGGAGHIHKNCNHPVISYGIILVRRAPDTNDMQYLMVQRKDSLAFVEFVRGKYQLENPHYILRLFDNMTSVERDAIVTSTFEGLWDRLWVDHHQKERRSFAREFVDAKAKFERLKGGYMVRGAPALPGHEEDEEDDGDDGDDVGARDNSAKVRTFDVDKCMAASCDSLATPEWGFAKGRRNLNESDVACALREFMEETGIPIASVRILQDLKPVEEVFSGLNKVRYKHVYYVATLNDDDVHFGDGIAYDPTNATQRKEIRDVKWFTYEQAQDHIRARNVERKEMLSCVQQTLKRVGF